MGRYAIYVVAALFLSITYMMISAKGPEESALKETIELYNKRMALNIANSYAYQKLDLIRSAAFKDTPEYMASISEEHKIKRPLRGDIDVVVERDDATGEIVITATTNIEDQSVTVVVRDWELPYSYYAYFVNRFTGGWYGNGEDFWGPVHCNGEFRVDRDRWHSGVFYPGPIFHGNLTTYNGLYVQGSGHYHDDDDIPSAHYSGLTGDNNDLSHRKIPFNSSALSIDYSKVTGPPLDIETLFSTKPGDVHIFMYDDGSIKFVSDDGTKTVTMDVADITSHVIVAKRDIHIQGTLDGNLSIETSKTLFIDGDLIYKDATKDVNGNPVVPEDSDDMLGLIADDIIIPADNHYDPGGEWPGCMTMANIVTPNDVTIKNWGGKYYGFWTTFGSRLQSEPVVTWNGNLTKPKGFKERIVYDSRFRTKSPPGIPDTGERRVTQWTESD